MQRCQPAEILPLRLALHAWTNIGSNFLHALHLIEFRTAQPGSMLYLKKAVKIQNNLKKTYLHMGCIAICFKYNCTTLNET